MMTLDEGSIVALVRLRLGINLRAACGHTQMSLRGTTRTCSNPNTGVSKLPRPIEPATGETFKRTDNRRFETLALHGGSYRVIKPTRKTINMWSELFLSPRKLYEISIDRFWKHLEIDGLTDNSVMDFQYY
jgi:hypothetical protein